MQPLFPKMCRLHARLLLLLLLLVTIHGIISLYAAMDQRDIAAVIASLASDVQYQNLALLDTFAGQTVSGSRDNRVTVHQ